MKTKEKILIASAELFNRAGVSVTTTNHIAKHMNISPGNLYFHYGNKEEILSELFRKMRLETYSLWRPQNIKEISPLEFIDKNFEIYWKFRFFHREMYSLRRRDASLAKMWRAHIQKMLKLMIILYRQWVDLGYMTPVKRDSELAYISESLLAMSTTYLQFFESAEKQPGKKSIERGKRHLARLIFPYTQGATRKIFEEFIGSL